MCLSIYTLNALTDSFFKKKPLILLKLGNCYVCSKNHLTDPFNSVCIHHHSISGEQKSFRFFHISPPYGGFCLILKTITCSTGTLGFSELYGHSTLSTISLSNYNYMFVPKKENAVMFPIILLQFCHLGSFLVTTQRQPVPPSVIIQALNFSAILNSWKETDENNPVCLCIYYGPSSLKA